MSTYNKALEKYIGHMYKEITSEKDCSKKDILDIKTVDHLIFMCFRNYNNENNLKLELVTEKKHSKLMGKFF